MKTYRIEEKRMILALAMTINVLSIVFPLFLLWELSHFVWQPEARHRLPAPIAIDVDRLNYRDARKVAKRLSIRQTVNGKDKSLAWLRREIRQKLDRADGVTLDVTARRAS